MEKFYELTNPVQRCDEVGIPNYMSVSVVSDNTCPTYVEQLIHNKWRQSLNNIGGIT